jgi:hypothetical protein
MGATIPFSKYNVDFEHIEAMRAAFHRVCDLLRLDYDTDDAMTELVTTKIMERAGPASSTRRDYALTCWPNWRQRHRLHRGTKPHLRRSRPAAITVVCDDAR